MLNKEQKSDFMEGISAGAGGVGSTFLRKGMEEMGYFAGKTGAQSALVGLAGIAMPFFFGEKSKAFSHGMIGAAIAGVSENISLNGLSRIQPMNQLSEQDIEDVHYLAAMEEEGMNALSRIVPAQGGYDPAYQGDNSLEEESEDVY